MSKVLDFSTATEAVASQGSTLVRPGTIDKFTVEKLEIKSVGEGDNAKDVANVTFTSASGNLRESFFITQAALPRIKHLLSQFLRKPFETQMSYDQLVATLNGLVNTSAYLRVTGKLNTDKGTVYPNLPYGGFAAQSAEELSWTPKEQAQLVELQQVFDNYKPKKEGEETATPVDSTVSPF
jgi:hypothetical protein